MARSATGHGSMPAESKDAPVPVNPKQYEYLFLYLNETSRIAPLTGCSMCSSGTAELLGGGELDMIGLPIQKL